MTKNSEEVGFFGGFRVAGIMIKDEKILLQTDDFNDFWTTPGGGIKMFESSEEALKREFQEELNAEISVERLLYIIENSFKFDEKLYHGLELYFLITPKNSVELFAQEEFIGIENDYMPEKYGDEFKLTFRWFHPSEFDSIEIRPVILKNALQNLPDHPVLLRNLEIKNSFNK
ncbi:MAG: NUDIX domain-containing protein [Asgard group archaeon]|nr:NUDIX domain-containing protein [Asgard group archaeon]